MITKAKVKSLEKKLKFDDKNQTRNSISILQLLKIQGLIYGIREVSTEKDKITLDEWEKYKKRELMLACEKGKDLEEVKNGLRKAEERLKEKGLFRS